MNYNGVITTIVQHYLIGSKLTPMHVESKAESSNHYRFIVFWEDYPSNIKQ